MQTFRYRIPEMRSTNLKLNADRLVVETGYKDEDAFSGKQYNLILTQNTTEETKSKEIEIEINGTKYQTQNFELGLPVVACQLKTRKIYRLILAMTDKDKGHFKFLEPLPPVSFCTIPTEPVKSNISADVKTNSDEPTNKTLKGKTPPSN